MDMREFHSSVYRNDIASVKECLRSGIEGVSGSDLLEREDKVFSRTPLSLACYFGAVEMVEFLISQGANVNILAPEGGISLLDEVALRNKRFPQGNESLESIIVLLENAIVEKALNYSIKTGNMEKAKQCIDHGANFPAVVRQQIENDLINPQYVESEFYNELVEYYRSQFEDSPSNVLTHR